MKPKFNKKRYLKQGGVRCPYCNGMNISARAADCEIPGALIQVVDCNDCEWTWEDTYKLTDVRKWG